MDDLDRQIDSFLATPAFGVAGASEDKRKYGHKVMVCYQQNGRKVYPINPKTDNVLGETCYANISAIPDKLESLSIITPPPVTEVLVEEAIKCGVKNIWMQPGAESRAAVQKAKDAGLNVIYGGPCLLVVLGYHE